MQSLMVNSLFTLHFNGHASIQIGSVSTTQINSRLANNLLTPQKNSEVFGDTARNSKLKIERKIDRSKTV